MGKVAGFSGIFRDSGFGKLQEKILGSYGKLQNSGFEIWEMKKAEYAR